MDQQHRQFPIGVMAALTSLPNGLGKRNHHIA